MLSTRKMQSRFLKEVSKVRHEVEDRIRHFQQTESASKFINNKEIRVIGLRRSGNHAIMNWVRKQHSGEVFFINNAPINVNPFRNVYEDQVRKSKDPNISGWRTNNLERWRREAKGKFAIKDCLLYSYEDQALKRLSSRHFEKKHNLYLGKSKVRYDLIIVRDPYNLFASRLRANRRDNKAAEFTDFMKVKSRHISLPQLWIDYAKEYLCETNYLHNIKIPVNYNQWVFDVEYRRQIAEKLGIDFTDSGFNDVMTNGGGSSFDGVDLQGKASEMSVLERWKSFYKDPDFRALVRNEKLIEYSLKIFGSIPGTDGLYEKY